LRGNFGKHLIDKYRRQKYTLPPVFYFAYLPTNLPPIKYKPPTVGENTLFIKTTHYRPNFHQGGSLCLRSLLNAE
jgi:hypothetical protein